MTLLLERPFRTYWVFNEFAYFSVWMNTVAIGWSMTQMSASTFMVASVQAAASLPVAFAALPAGILADRWERRRFLFWVNAWMTAVGAAMVITYAIGAVTPAILLVFAALMAVGMGANFPASQAMSADIVEPPKIMEAAALNTLGSNLARSFGPPAGAAILTIAGPIAVFAYGMLSRAALGIMYWFWPASESRLVGFDDRKQPPMSFGGILKQQAFIPTLSVTFLLFLSGSAFWALLPVYANTTMPGESANLLGWCMGSTGLGAVVATGFLKRLRMRMSDGWVAFFLCIACALGLAGLTKGTGFLQALGACGLFGIGWGAMVAILNGKTQSIFSSQVRARAISLNILAMYVGMGLGSLIVGVLADQFGISSSLLSASSLLVALALISAFVL
ncbi:MFS transporter [Phyllobacterium leguminum]|uniref:Putative MFS family arabinose efflux permease n=1 Tax=Phyllobacterium leguminum TaxID=314237 RepID=A0A318TDU3_9HYPH|nr:MFS transporter [Phyllobacterium leguminum]PYE86502.1 putative MFS family arabinose efflux permease [Phyllobacterium leguminum]